MKKFILFASVLMLLTSCVKQQEIPKSDIIGFVKLHDVIGAPLDDFSGITITAESNGKSISVTSDKLGKFILPSMEVGTYNLTYSSPVFPTVKKYSVMHNGLGNNFIGSLSLSAKPDFVITNFQVTTGTSTSYNNLSGNCSKNEVRNFIAFYSKNTNVKDNFTAILNYQTSAGGKLSVSSYNSTLYSRGFAVGETVYVALYPSTAFPNTYTDFETGKLIYPALGQGTSVQSFILQ